MACNRASADYLISSPLLSAPYHRYTPDYPTTELEPADVPSRT